MYILNGKERSCLKTIARRTRIDYLEKNKYTYLEDDIDMFEENIFVSTENVEKDFEMKFDRDICAYEIEKVFMDPYKLKSIKALTLREKLVFYSYYWENKTDKEIGEALNINGDTVRKIRERAKNKALKNYQSLKEKRDNNV